MKLLLSRLRFVKVFGSAACVAGAAWVLLGCPLPRKSDVPIVRPVDVIARLAKGELGPERAWLWRYRVTPIDSSALPHGFDRDRFAAELTRLHQTMGLPSTPEYAPPRAEELIPLEHGNPAGVWTWLDPRMAYSSGPGDKVVSTFTRYLTAGTGELLSQEVVHRVAAAVCDEVREAVIVDNAKKDAPLVRTRKVARRDLPTFPESAFTPWAFGLSCNPTVSQRTRTISKELAEWQVWTVAPTSLWFPTVQPSPLDILLRADRWAQGGQSQWTSSLALAEPQDGCALRPTGMAWYQDGCPFGEVVIEAWCPAPPQQPDLAVPRRARRIAYVGAPARSQGASFDYEVAEFGDAVDSAGFVTNIEEIVATAFDVASSWQRSEVRLYRPGGPAGVHPPPETGAPDSGPTEAAPSAAKTETTVQFICRVTGTPPMEQWMPCGTAPIYREVGFSYLFVAVGSGPWPPGAPQAWASIKKELT